MVRAVILLLVASLALSACGWRDSRLNPGNWFGRSQPVEIEGEAVPTNPLLPNNASILSRPEAQDRHVQIYSVSELAIERTSSGAIIRAEGTARVQGAYAARLKPASETGEPVDGVMTYSFEVLYPENPRPVGTEISRRVIVARSLTHQDLSAIRVIRVTSETNAREARRR
ncbi:MAG: hypothetical protein JJ897_16380 [Marinibacterium sp.]|nr:hypothetical protein [Marinibacterium sp.]